MARAQWLLVTSSLLLAAACGSKADSPAAAEAPAAEAPPSAQPAAPSAPKPVEHPDPSLPVSKRMQGKWRMDIDKVPDAALTEEFRKLKQQGKGKQLLITYTVTDTEFSMETHAPGSVYRSRFQYEILRESGDGMILKKIDEQGKASEVGIVLKEDDQLIIGAGLGAVPLQRLALPEARR